MFRVNLKLAPEHTSTDVLNLMGKPGSDQLLEFKKRFDLLNKKFDKKQFLTYYFIAAHPGCDENEMIELRDLQVTNCMYNQNRYKYLPRHHRLMPV